MAIYEIYLPPEDRFAGHMRHQQAKPVSDRASILALIFPLIWLIYHRLWFWTVAYLLVAFFLNGLAATPLALVGVAMTFIPGLFIYLEGPNLIASKLETNGYEFAGLVEAYDADNALMGWLEKNNVDDNAPANPFPTGQVAPSRSQHADDGDFGLFAHNG